MATRLFVAGQHLFYHVSEKMFLTNHANLVDEGSHFMGVWYHQKYLLEPMFVFSNCTYILSLSRKWQRHSITSVIALESFRTL